jgi:hypothetical protein
MSAAESWLTHEVIFVSKQLSKAPVWLTFSRIQQLYADYRDGLNEEEKKLSGTDLKSDLSELTRDNVMFQGVELRCRNCLSSYWYSVEEMQKAVRCRGCHVSFPLPAETQWSYQLNELIRVAIADQGLVPVLRTLARLFDGARDCFFFTPSVEFLAYRNDGEPRVERELDLAWVKDGLFGIAEVKSTTSYSNRATTMIWQSLLGELDQTFYSLLPPKVVTKTLLEVTKKSKKNSVPRASCGRGDLKRSKTRHFGRCHRPLFSPSLGEQSPA